MNYLFIACAILLSVNSASAEDTESLRPIPQQGYVPTEETATKIAQAVWIPIYGADKIKDEEPYHAKLDGNTWTVEGTLHQHPGAVMHGGTAMAKISKIDGRVIDVWHEK